MVGSGCWGCDVAPAQALDEAPEGAQQRFRLVPARIAEDDGLAAAVRQLRPARPPRAPPPHRPCRARARARPPARGARAGAGWRRPAAPRGGGSPRPRCCAGGGGARGGGRGGGAGGRRVREYGGGGRPCGLPPPRAGAPPRPRFPASACPRPDRRRASGDRALLCSGRALCLRSCPRHSLPGSHPVVCVWRQRPHSTRCCAAHWSSMPVRGPHDGHPRPSNSSFAQS